MNPARITVEGRELCPECNGEDPTCVCGGSGYIRDFDEIDAEDVQPVGRAPEQLEHPR